MEPLPVYRIVALSDIHCGDPRFDSKLLTLVIHEINQLGPDLVVVGGDLTADGYREQFVAAKEYMDLIDCRRKAVVPGNHDCRNVGYVHFEDLFGPRDASLSFPFGVSWGNRVQENIRVVATDSGKPDLNDGEIGREHYAWIKQNFHDPDDFKLFILHHHLVSVPGTGRERNIVLDAGDVLATLREASVDLVLCGHKHVPYVWQVGDLLLVNSGTAATHRTRGFSTPSYSVIDIRPERIDVSIVTPGEATFKTESFVRPKAFPDLKRMMAETTTEVTGRPPRLD
ncbi:MAG: metallophosphoesterase [Actinomycetota bacterium]|nr:metallophosphoesterase [Actinomycetota bacterium]